MDNMAFVYRKDDKIKCVAHGWKSEQMHEHLKTQGWQHIATIDPCGAIETMYNEKKSAKKYFK